MVELDKLVHIWDDIMKIIQIDLQNLSDDQYFYLLQTISEYKFMGYNIDIDEHKRINNITYSDDLYASLKEQIPEILMRILEE